jgi:hypothetical protein
MDPLVVLAAFGAGVVVGVFAEWKATQWRDRTAAERQFPDYWR